MVCTIILYILYELCTGPVRFHVRPKDSPIEVSLAMAVYWPQLTNTMLCLQCNVWRRRWAMLATAGDTRWCSGLSGSHLKWERWVRTSSRVSFWVSLGLRICALPPSRPDRAQRQQSNLITPPNGWHKNQDRFKNVELYTPFRMCALPPSDNNQT